jgi:predicted HNH restriction endonuclease
MHETKALLIKKNGLKCMLCGREVPYSQINWHHIKPKAVSKYYGEPIDNSYENGALLCLECHAYVHQFYYWGDVYPKLMERIIKNRKPSS